MNTSDNSVTTLGHRSKVIKYLKNVDDTCKLFTLESNNAKDLKGGIF